MAWAIATSNYVKPERLALPARDFYPAASCLLIPMLAELMGAQTGIRLRVVKPAFLDRCCPSPALQGAGRSPSWQHPPWQAMSWS